MRHLGFGGRRSRDSEAGRDFESLYRHADEALHRAKKAGKSRFARYED